MASAKRLGKSRRRLGPNAQVLIIAVVLAGLMQAAFASVSLSTGAVLPGWEQVRTGRQGDDAKRIARNYASQVGVVCAIPDVHTKQNARLLSRTLHVDTWFNSVGTMRVLMEGRDQHVLLLEPRTGSRNHLIVVFQVGDDLLLVAC